MIENEENRVHFLLDKCDENGSVLIKKEDMELILKHQRELGVEEVRGCLEQIRWERDIAISQLEDIGASFGLKMSLWLDEHDKEVRKKAVEEGKKSHGRDCAETVHSVKE